MSKLLIFFGALVLVGFGLAFSLLGFQKSLTREATSQLEVPRVTPRAQGEFESGSIFRAYAEASRAELEKNPSLDKVMHWMLTHQNEALK